VFVAAVTSRVSRLASDTRDTSQRTTRSQTRLLSEKGRDVSGKASGGHKLSRVAGESSTLPEKVQSLERKQGRSRSSATKSDRASDDNKASTKVPHYDIAVTSAELSKPPAAAVTSGKASRGATRSTETMPPPTGLDWSLVRRPVDADEANEDTTAMDENVADSAAESKPEASTSSVTPGRSRRTRSMMSPSLSFASVRKTPKNLRNSLLLRRMSPEDGYVCSIV